MSKPKLIVVVLALACAAAVQDARPGYQDTPKLPNSEWTVHDSRRPYPTVVDPDGKGANVPGDAIVLFDGTGLDAFRSARGGAAAWKLVDGAMEVNGSGDIVSAESFGSCQLHIEWRAPSEPKGESQGRGNSGLFLMNRYEVQILDSFQNATYADGQAAALYGQRPPLVNACRGPGAWQSYDVVFRAPRFDGESVIEPARVTVLHNGVVVHDAAEFIGATGHKQVGVYRAHGPNEPLRLQDHGNPVRYRNIWLRRLD